MNQIVSLINTWRINARSIALPQSLIPAILAVALAGGAPRFSWGLSIFAVVGVICLHLGLNLFDDYFDFRYRDSSHRDRLAHRGIRARIAKCEYLTSGRHNTKELFTAASLFCLVALLFGLLILYYRSEAILYIALAGAAIGIFYSAPPLRLSYHGLGDLSIGIMFGPLLMTGVYMAACGSFSSEIILISVPVGLLVMNIAYTHDIMDFEPDREVGKNTMAVMLGNKTAILSVSGLLQIIPFILIAYGVYNNALSPLFLLVFLTLPMGVGLIRSLYRFTKSPSEHPTPQWWMGPMPNWENIQKSGIDWFMVRWLIARNFLSLFCLLCLIATLASRIWAL